MPNLAKNVLINGKVYRKGKAISAANVKKLGLGDHLFEKASKGESSPEPKGEEPKGDGDEDKNPEE